jgi:signal transduction histidine kinase
MRSLYLRIFLTCCGTLFVALCCFFVISLNVGLERSSKNFKRVFALELDIAEQIYNDHGPQALAAFLREQDEAFDSRHFVVDAEGRDILTGKDLHDVMARRKPKSWTRRMYHLVSNTEATFITPSPTGRLSTVTITRPWSNSRAQFPYYLGVLIVVSVLNALVAARIVSALQNIARTAQQFGEGDLEARVTGAERQDEVGLVSQAFNKMADRIHALVVSERRLLQDVSHEIRSPLTRLSFAIELAQNSEDTNAAFALVRRQVNTLKGLATSLLQITRASDGRPLRANEPVALGGLVNDVVEANGLNALQKRCRVVVERLTNSAVVTGDRALLTRVLDNVLRNAIEYSPLDSRIDVEVRQEGGEAVLAVRDYGSGVPDVMLANIFEPFFRVDESRESSTGGLGLGLAIVKRSVLLHGGSVTANNAEPGLLITVRLPMASSNDDTSSGGMRRAVSQETDLVA